MKVLQTSINIMTKSIAAFVMSVSLLSPVLAMADDTSTGVSAEAQAEVEVKYDVKSPRDAASGLPTGKRMHKPLMIRKEIDKATPLLFKAVAECETKCGAEFGTDEDAVVACEDRCVAAAELKHPRDAASGLSAGKVRPSYDVKANVKARMSMNAEEREAAMEERKEEMKTRMESRKEAIDDWHTQLKARLAAWKDKTKAEIAERIQTNLDALNERMTKHFDTQLDTMVSIMVRVSAGDVNGDGAADISLANTAIANAQAANDDQADNTYAVNVSTEATAKADVGAARKKLHDDLKAVWEKVKAAREAVRKAASHIDKPAVEVSADADASAE